FAMNHKRDRSRWGWELPFRPVNDRHAIQEVVFAVGMQGLIQPPYLHKLESAHAEFKEDLPQVEKLQGWQISLPGATGDALSSGPTDELTGIRFSAYKRNGALDWRLSAENRILAVNCLTYTRWAEIWERARHLLYSATVAMTDDANPIVSIGLQYIDLFLWDGKVEDYNAAELIQQDSAMMPRSIWNRGPYWHLHQGWFESAQAAVEGRLLRRVHMDAIDVQPGVVGVRMDTLLKLDLKSPPINYKALFESSDSLGTKVVQDLHSLNKATMLKILTKDMAERIDLHA
ncbi:MAG: TIGR04255 family protein, partial [Pseudomonadales bacterium]